tara:strand:+ start:1936 stop:2427 length:492 start_codon:yes stop_codon:yes gene_type:complete
MFGKIFKGIKKVFKKVVKGVKGAVKGVGRFVKKHKKALLTVAAIAGMIYTGGAMAGYFPGPEFLTGATTSAATGAATGASTNVLRQAVGKSLFTTGTGTAVATGVSQLTGGDPFGYETPEGPFIPGTPRLQSSGERYTRSTGGNYDSLNYGIGGTTINPYAGI